MRAFYLLCLFFLPNFLHGQNIDLMMQAWYWDYFQNGNFGTWINQLNTKTTALKNAGFRHIWLPPLSRSSTPNNISNGYNPMDLYDLGQYGAPCAWGTRTQLNTLITNFNNNGLSVVSDMIYNHRDGGKPEKNPAVKFFMTDPGTSAVYPSDRVFYVLPLGTANPGNNGPGDYYIKVKSKASNNSYGANTYKFYARTNSTSVYLGTVNESEPNGGSPCGQPSNPYSLGQDVLCTLWDYSGCYTDEFKITLNSSNFNTTDDTLRIYMVNASGGYSDHYIFGIYSAPRNTDIVNELEYWTYSNYYNLPSGRGGMNYNAFRPNDVTANAGGVSENFSWPLQYPLFFYDYDQSRPLAYDSLNAWTRWQLQQGIKGLRMDAVKHFDPQFVGQLLTYLYNNNNVPEMVVGEYFDYNAGLLTGWVNSVYASMSTAARSVIRVRAFDFSLRAALKSACDQFGYDVRNVFNSGMVRETGTPGFNVVTFVDNHDIRHEGNGIQNDARLAYAYMLTNNQLGAPCVFYPDYYGVQVGNTPLINLKDEIDYLVYLHKAYIYGSTETDNLSRFSTPYTQYFVPNGNNGSAATTLIYQIKPSSSGKNVIVAINFSGTPLDVYQKINTGWGAGANTPFTDMLGVTGTNTTYITPNNEIRVTLPARSYTVYVQGENVPLPVTLHDFQAFAQHSDVWLKWSSSAETNFSHYELERSVGDQLDFQRLATLPATAELRNGLKNYQYTDVLPPVNTPLYYRLKMVDTDGSFKYSAVRQQRLERRQLEARLAPNPARGPAMLLLDAAVENQAQVQVLNAWGQLQWESTQDLQKGENLLPLPLFRPGTYQVRIRGNQEQETLTLLQM
jgi:hypothetical protein